MHTVLTQVSELFDTESAQAALWESRLKDKLECANLVLPSKTWAAWACPKDLGLAEDTEEEGEWQRHRLTLFQEMALMQGVDLLSKCCEVGPPHSRRASAVAPTTFVPPSTFLRPRVTP